MDTSAQRDLTAERVARNEAVFRDANERIEQAAADYALNGRVPFLCECADPGCTQIVQLTLRDYEEVRSDPRLFINAVGHDSAAGPHSVVVERRDGFVVSEKQGEAARIVTALDPRGSAQGPSDEGEERG